MDIRSEILFYGDASAFNMVIPIIMYFLTFTHRKDVILCKTLASSAT